MCERNPDLICRHFLKPSTSAGCEAGVVYGELAERAGLHKSNVVSICMGRLGGCDSYQKYTPEEIAAEETKLEAQVARIARARQAVIDKAGGKRGINGVIECPICSGSLHWSVSEHDADKTIGKCLSKSCVRWQEYESKIL